MRQVTKRGEDLVLEFEGLRLKKYLDTSGLPTIGIGHLLTKSELASGKIRIGGVPVKWSFGLTREQAFDLLRQDLDIAEEAVDRLAPGLTDGQFDALVSFTFNLGVEAFEGSTLLRKIRAGDLEAVPQQLMRWNKDEGKVLAGLTRRRQAEVDLWTS